MPTSPPTGPVTDQLTTRLQRTEIQRAASSIPGRVIVQVVTEIPEGVESGWHTHPGEEVGTSSRAPSGWRSRERRSSPCTPVMAS
jgi:quercetin dioxygenase-like cupin family protein